MTIKLEWIRRIVVIIMISVGLLLAGCNAVTEMINPETSTPTLTVTPIPTATPTPTVTPTPTETPTPTPAHLGGGAGLIVFISNRNDVDGDDTFDTDIFTMNVDGSNVVQLTFEDGSETNPSLSPDGERLIYSKGNNVYIINTDGTGEKKLFSGGKYSDPAWSPDGSRIVFISDKNGNWDIYTGALDGSDIQQITDNELPEAEPHISPDGKKITFHAFEEGNGHDIFLINDDGSDQQKITDDNRWNTSPSWSPDGKQIIYTSWDLSPLISGSKFMIFTTAAGREIFLYDQTNSEMIDLKASIRAIELDSKAISILKEGNGSYFGPSWSPDGQYFLFSSKENGQTDIIMVGIDDSEVNLTDHEKTDLSPDW